MPGPRPCTATFCSSSTTMLGSPIRSSSGALLPPSMRGPNLGFCNRGFTIRCQMPTQPAGFHAYVRATHANQVRPFTVWEGALLVRRST